MRGNIKYLIGMLLIITIINLVSASNPSFGVFKINEPAELKQICFINGTQCDECNITSIDYPNNGSRAVSDISMTKRIGDFNYTFNSATILGRYNVNGYCSYGTDVIKPFVAYFDITPSGKISTTGDSILYSLISIILFSVIFLLTFYVFAIPSKNDKDERGFENKIVKLKYIRVFFIALIYGLTIILLNFLNGLAINFSSLSLFAGTLGFLFETMLRLAWGFTVIMIAWIVVMLIHDSNLNKQLKKLNNLNLYQNG